MEQLNVDDMALYDLGIDVPGTFDYFGLPTGWEITPDRISEEMPRWIAEQPVLYIQSDTPNVYIRGMHSKKFTAMRAKALLLAAEKRAAMFPASATP